MSFSLNIAFERRYMRKLGSKLVLFIPTCLSRYPQRRNWLWLGLWCIYIEIQITVFLIRSLIVVTLYFINHDDTITFHESVDKLGGNIHV